MLPIFDVLCVHRLNSTANMQLMYRGIYRDVDFGHFLQRLGSILAVSSWCVEGLGMDAYLRV